MRGGGEGTGEMRVKGRVRGKRVRGEVSWRGEVRERGCAIDGYLPHAFYLLSSILLR